MNCHRLIRVALDAGASLAGIVAADALRASPSHRETATATLPETVQAVLVLALHHPIDEPKLDHWGVEGDTRGNLSLIRSAVNRA